MSFSEHFRTKIFGERLDDTRILVVYDPSGRYGGICGSMASDTCTVLNANGKPLSTRLEAMNKWQDLCRDTALTSQLLIYTSDPPPASREEKIVNPYSAYVAMGSCFPDGARDDYQQICYSFLPDRRTEIDQLFEGNSEPEIEHIDNLASGSDSHPRLEIIFKTGEITKILENFLVPEQDISNQLDASTDWCPEMKSILSKVFDFELNAQITSAGTIREKLWQFLLFSEFADDLPGNLPESLNDIPKATKSSCGIVTNLCKTLRNSIATRSAYRESANRVEAALDLAAEFQDIDDLGECDTFAFEEAQFLKFAVRCLIAKDFDRASAILQTHQQSIWTEEGERSLLWQILNYALEIITSIKANKEALNHVGAMGADLAHLYADKLSYTDQIHRTFSSAITHLYEGKDEIEDVILLANKEYRDFVNALQDQLIPRVQHEGWPLDGIPHNKDTFKDAILPKLGEKRVVYFLIDALRLELTNTLNDHLSKNYKCELTTVCAQLPCVTRFGMASLIPEADTKLKFRLGNDEKLHPYIDDDKVSSRTERLSAFERYLGGRVKSYQMQKFLNHTDTNRKLIKLQDDLAEVDLLVITSTEVDAVGESDEWLRGYLEAPLKKLIRAITISAEIGYDVAVVSADHGFLWIDKVDQGTTCEKPSSGEWPLKKRRCFVGTGDAPTGSVTFKTTAVGIPCDQPSFIVPHSIGVYERGAGYFHEGISLQEALLSRMEIDLSTNINQTLAPPSTTVLALNRPRKKVSSVIVSVSLSWPSEGDFFADTGTTPEFGLSVTQGTQSVGTLIANDHINASTKHVRIHPGASIKVTIRLDEQKIKEGEFKVKVIDLRTDKPIDTLTLTYDPNI